MSINKLKGFLLIGAFILISAAPLLAQTYKNAIGVRMGGTSGFTFKHFYAGQMAMEGQIGFFGNGASVTGLLMGHGSAFSTPGLRYYAGGGAHLAFYNGRTYSAWRGRDIQYYDSDAIAVGVNGILGLEYVLPDVPIGFSMDIKPFIEFGPGGHVGFSPDPSVGVKFIIR